MQDIIIPGAIVAYLSKNFLEKLLGPTANYLGEELKTFVEIKAQNIAKVFSNAEKKLGSRIDSPGRVPPKVLKEVINAGAYAEDDIAVEYLGGVLASSKTEMGRDDRGARLIKIIDNLSSYQLRTHYLIYSTVAHIFSNPENSFALSEDRNKMEIFIPSIDYIRSMQFIEKEINDMQIMSHIWHGLSSENLIENTWGYGDQKILHKIASSAPGDGIICRPSALGAELFLWAFGYANRPIDYILSGKIKIQVNDLPDYISGAISTKREGG